MLLILPPGFRIQHMPQLALRDLLVNARDTIPGPAR